MKMFLVIGALSALILGGTWASRHPTPLQPIVVPKILQAPKNEHDYRGGGGDNHSYKKQDIPNFAETEFSKGHSTNERTDDNLNQGQRQQDPPGGTPDSIWAGLKITDLVISFASCVGIAIATLQWRTYERQAAIMDRQVIALGPNMHFDDYKCFFMFSKLNRSVVEKFSITIGIKNLGQSVATKFNYWVGDPEFVPHNRCDADFYKTAQKDFITCVFRSDNMPGDIYLPPNKIMFTALKEVSANAFDGHVMIIGVVFRCGSKLAEQNWFEETAILLEFSLAHTSSEPDILALNGTNKIFNVSSRAYRYREAYDQESSQNS